MIKKFFSALALVLFATSVVAQSGLTCDDPIPVDKNYKGKVEGPCELWYTANTYDLPLHVYFSPDSAGSEWSPEVYVDFTCEPGVYDDPKLDSLLTKISIFGLELPLEFMCDGVFRNGKNEWDLFISQSYREQLAESGITYNVKALIKVVYYEGGSISLEPDTTFTSCMDNAHYVQLGDTIDILPNDSDRVFVMPYTDWQNDSIQFVWVGEQSVNVWMATQECDFTPELSSIFVWDVYNVATNASHKLQQQEIVDIIKENKSGGLFFSKIIAPVAGKLVVEKIPMAPIKGGATLLEYGKSVYVKNADQLFCFPRTWKATEFVGSAAPTTTMYVAASPDFTASLEDANVLAAYTFVSDDGVNRNCVSSKEMQQLLSKTTEDYLYVRFQCGVSTTIVAESWDASDCANKSLMIRPNQQINIPANDKSTIYRMRYADWEGYDMIITWTGNSTLPTYIADTCSFTLSSSSSRVLKYLNIKRKGTATITADNLATWYSRVDADGYVYVCFNPTNSGRVTFTSSKPVVLDPIYTNVEATLCYGETYTWNGQEYGISGEYQQTLVAANGADSIVTLKLTILPEVPATTEKAEIIAGETYTWNGKDYTEAGEYTITLQDKNGCDYQATLILNVLPPLSPCLQASVKLNVGDELKLSLASAFTVYAIDYNAWMQQAVTLVWTGVEPLHMFVAETCEFALAPYNRYVHAYVPVPAQGDWVLDMDALAPYVDEDGYLYVRFLTEFEGTLKVGR